jgi:hypothetical protein
MSLLKRDCRGAGVRGGCVDKTGSGSPRCEGAHHCVERGRGGGEDEESTSDNVDVVEIENAEVNEGDDVDESSKRNASILSVISVRIKVISITFTEGSG